MRKTSGITDVTPMPPTSLTQRPTSLRQGQGRRLSDISGAQQQPDWMMQPDESGNLLTAIGKGAWTAFETAGFGIPRLLLPEAAKEWLEPKSFVERVGAGIGGAAGFLIPMRGAATLMSLGVKCFAKGGVQRFSKGFVDSSVKVMEKDKNFVKWIQKKMQRGEIEETTIREFMDNILQAPKSKLLAVGSKEGDAV